MAEPGIREVSGVAYKSIFDLLSLYISKSMPGTVIDPETRGFLDILGLRRLRCLVCPADFAIGVRDVRGVFVFGVWGAEFVGVVDVL